MFVSNSDFESLRRKVRSQGFETERLQREVNILNNRLSSWEKKVGKTEQEEAHPTHIYVDDVEHEVVERKRIYAGNNGAVLYEWITAKNARTGGTHTIHLSYR